MSDCTDPVRSHIVTAPLRNGDLSWTESPDPFIFNVLLTSLIYLTLTSTFSVLSSARAHTHTHTARGPTASSHSRRRSRWSCKSSVWCCSACVMIRRYTNKGELNWRSRRRSSATTSRQSGLLTTEGSRDTRRHHLPVVRLRRRHVQVSLLAMLGWVSAKHESQSLRFTGHSHSTGTETLPPQLGRVSRRHPRRAVIEATAFTHTFFAWLTPTKRQRKPCNGTLVDTTCHGHRFRCNT